MSRGGGWVGHEGKGGGGRGEMGIGIQTPFVPSSPPLTCMPQRQPGCWTEAKGAELINWLHSNGDWLELRPGNFLHRCLNT